MLRPTGRDIYELEFGGGLITYAVAAAFTEQSVSHASRTDLDGSYLLLVLTLSENHRKELE